MYKLAIEEYRTEELKSLHSLLYREDSKSRRRREQDNQGNREIEDRAHQHRIRDVLWHLKNTKKMYVEIKEVDCQKIQYYMDVDICDMMCNEM